MHEFAVSLESSWPRRNVRADEKLTAFLQLESVEERTRLVPHLRDSRRPRRELPMEHARLIILNKQSDSRGRQWQHASRVRSPEEEPFISRREAISSRVSHHYLGKFKRFP
jgi:hypothetical protein